MKLDNFKELLSKKAKDKPNLQLLIKYMKDEYLVDHVIESLSKMAHSDANKNVNHALMHFGTHMDPETEGNMIRDALSHHASHYKSALNSGNEKLADTHMKKIMKILHMGQKLTRDGKNHHARGKLDIEAIDPKPWERQAYLNVGASGKMSDTKGFGRDRSDYSYLRGAPHESYGDETKAHGHTQAYPLNKIKVNGKYLHIDDVEPTDEHVPHVFDDHPIMKHYKTSPKNFTSQNQTEYLESVDAFQDNIDQYLDSLDLIEGYDDRGINLPDAIHKPLPSGDESIDKLKQIMGDDFVPPTTEAKQSPTSTPAPVDKPKVVKKPEQPGSQVSEAEAKIREIMGKDFVPPKPKE